MSNIDFDTYNGDIIKTIQDSVETKILDLDEGQFLTRPVYRAPKLEPLRPLLVASLQALAAFVNRSLHEHLWEGGILVRVVNPRRVVVEGVPSLPTDNFVPFIEANFDATPFPFNTFLDQERFLIALQTQFVATDHRDVLQSALGNLVDDEQITTEDDGISQKIVVERGVVREHLKLANPYILAPYRTFPEVEQPLSPFILRLRSGNSSGAQAALYESDGGLWEVVARKTIASYLDDAIEYEGVPILA